MNDNSMSAVIKKFASKLNFECWAGSFRQADNNKEFVLIAAK